MNTEETYFIEDPGEGYIKVPDRAYLLSLLVNLLAEQEGVNIEYTIEDGDGKTLTLTTGEPFPGSKWTYKKRKE